jgi:hypothetical protein
MILFDWWSRFTARLPRRQSGAPTPATVAAAAENRIGALRDTLAELAEFDMFVESKAGQVIREQLSLYLDRAQDDVLQLIGDPPKNRIALQNLAAEVRLAREMFALFDPEHLLEARRQLIEELQSTRRNKEQAEELGKLALRMGKDLD